MTIKNNSLRVELARAVAAGSTIKDAAAALGVSLKQAYRWSEEPEFQRLLSDLQAEAVHEALSILCSGLADAARTLVALLSDPQSKVRLHAAGMLLDRALKVREAVDLEERIRALENPQTEEEPNAPKN